MTLLATDVRVERVVTPAPRNLWEHLVDADPGSLVDQSPAWVDVMAATAPHRDASRLYELSDGRRFVLPLVRRRRTGSTAGRLSGAGRCPAGRRGRSSRCRPAGGSGTC